jgi:hypothetical protein
MTTLEKIKMDGEAVIDKLKRCEPLTKDDKLVFQIYTTLYGKKAGNAGKRNNDKNVQKVR